MKKYIPLSEIVISEKRQRRAHDPIKHEDLKTSIGERAAGLLHPPVLRLEGDKYHLVAGERRLRAIAEIYELGGVIRHDGEEVPAGLVPFSELGDLDPIDAFEAELEENIRRLDLSPQEEAQATSDLMDLRLAQAARDGRPAPKHVDIARERFDVTENDRGQLDHAQNVVRKQLVVARHLQDPDVAKAKTLGEAFKIVKKKAETKKNEELAAIVGRTYSARSHTLLNLPCVEWMATQPEGQFDIILTDPPYGIGADEFGDSGAGVAAAAHQYDDSYESWAALMSVYPAAAYRLAAAEAHAYLFCDIERFHEMRTRMLAAGWKVHRTPLIWHNPDGFRQPWPERGPQRKYELILFAVKGEKRVTGVYGDVLAYRKDAGLGHPAQKPVGLLVDLLKRSARPGSKVLDTFGGSGSTVEACHQLQLACTMLERDPAHFGIAVKRVNGLKEQT